jgi:two-component system, cell cycle response regulator DivK
MLLVRNHRRGYIVMKVLVIEDNPMNMELAVDLLEVAGYEVLQATKAMDGIGVARAQHPDLILMDLGLPDMNGLQAAKILKEDPITIGIPIVALTAHSMPGDEATVIKAGFDGYISKPIDTRQFVRTLGKYLPVERSEK